MITSRLRYVKSERKQVDSDRIVEDTKEQVEEGDYEEKELKKRWGKGKSLD